MEIKSEEKIKFCKLCSQYCDNNFEVLKDEANKMLELLLFKPDINIGGEQIICSNCSSNIEISFKFKSSCLNTENYIKSHRNSEGDSKVNLNEIYVNGIDNKDRENLSEGAVVCRLCMKLVQNGCWAPLNDEKDKETFRMLKQWLPELDFSITEDPTLCMSCQKSLEDYFGFIKKCTNVEEKRYGCKEICDLDQNEWKLNLHFPLENDFILEDCCTEFKYQEDGNINKMIFNDKILMDIEAQEKVIEQAEIDIKSEDANFCRNDGAITHVNENAAIPKSKNSYNCGLCTFSTNTRTKLEGHMVVHQDASNAVMYNCEVCPFMTKHKSSLRVHMKIHRNPSEVMIYQCKACNYKTNKRASLNSHLRIHQSDLEVTLYQCESCEYKTKYKSSLKRHSFIHKYKYYCDKCSYKSNTQDDIDLHTLVHNEAIPKPKEVVYSCEMCPYKTRHKSTFSRHRVTHSDLRTHVCKVCGYKTRFKYNLGLHMRTHGSLKFHCEDCDFQTNHKRDLEKHSLLHLPATETKMFHCGNCKFITKYKKNLWKHMILHQKDSSMKMYRCDVCDFETKHKSYLKMHVLIHRDPSERKYACDMCDYKTIRNYSLLLHKSKKHAADGNK